MKFIELSPGKILQRHAAGARDSEKLLKRAEEYVSKSTRSIQKLRKKICSFGMSALSSSSGGDGNVDEPTVTDDGEPVALKAMRQYWSCVDRKFENAVDVGDASVVVSGSNAQGLVVGV